MCLREFKSFCYGLFRRGSFMIVDQLAKTAVKVIALSGLHASYELKPDLSCPLTFCMMNMQLVRCQLRWMVPASTDHTPMSKQLQQVWSRPKLRKVSIHQNINQEINVCVSGQCA